ncbi:MAG: hypothetical protein KME32_10480 [Mojavia pulchra JT2-VF2]|jgi:hypothetical protein|uniref:Uncharacterized protein n=1 Tax=Mojavia pulchra JT2-VF2 TaxID=287848 RepID=A0A951PYU0_9NOST|nr:hypothetical protein [Mojavia pulchra JT2-VF2]
MPMITSRQLKQPQSTFVSEYLLLHNGRQDSPAGINLVRTTPELYDFYEVNIR